MDACTVYIHHCRDERTIPVSMSNNFFGVQYGDMAICPDENVSAKIGVNAFSSFIHDGM